MVTVEEDDQRRHNSNIWRLIFQHIRRSSNLAFCFLDLISSSQYLFVFFGCNIYILKSFRKIE